VFSLKEWLLGAQIKLFWLDMARTYDQAMKNPDDVLTMEEDLADLEERKLALKRQSLELHNQVMPVEWIIIRFDKAFSKLEVLAAELRQRDYRIGKNRR
jgi:hypothetical protein